MAPIDLITKASQPVRDIAVLAAVVVYLATQFGAKTPPMQPTDPSLVDQASRDRFYQLSQETHDLWKWHDDGRDSTGGFLWYGKALLPVLEELLREERAQTRLLTKIVENGG